MVDPNQKKIIVLLFEGQTDIQIYGLGDTVPVSVLDGLCSIHFPEISDYISFLDLPGED